MVQESEYDGFGRRIVKAVKNSGGLDATYHYYYRGQSLIETRNGSGNVLKQQVWGLSYIDELVQTALNDDPADGTEDDVESYYYALQDAHFNVLGMVDDTGAMTERYEYTPYGQRTVYFSPGSNDPEAHAPTSISRRWTVGSTAQPYGLNDIGHQGLMHDEDTGLVYNRERMRTVDLERWLQREPLGYVDGMSLYQYVRSNPVLWVDPSGAQAAPPPGPSPNPFPPRPPIGGPDLSPPPGYVPSPRPPAGPSPEYQPPTPVPPPTVHLPSGPVGYGGDGFGLPSLTGNVRFRNCPPEVRDQLRVIPEGKGNVRTPINDTWYDTDGFYQTPQKNPGEWYKIPGNCDVTITCCKNKDGSYSLKSESNCHLLTGAGLGLLGRQSIPGISDDRHNLVPR